MLVGTSAYRAYFSREFGTERLYVSPFVKMEFRRSFILALISFYSVLDMEHIRTVEDAFTFWSNEFKTSRLKAVLQFAGKMFATEKLSFSNPADKPKALLAVGRIIKRINAHFSVFTDIGINSPRCARANVPLNIELSRLWADLKSFADKFTDVETCRSNCTVDTFLLNKHAGKIRKYIQIANGLKSEKTTDGFKKIAENLKQIEQKGSSACSCNRCEKIGDAIIAMDTLPDYILEHTDFSYNNLCELIGQPHRLHPSETAVIRSSAAST